jgi:hypothetical protein
MLLSVGNAHLKGGGITADLQEEGKRHCSGSYIGLFTCKESLFYFPSSFRASMRKEGENEHEKER